MNEATINNKEVDTQTAMNTNDAEQQLANIAKGAMNTNNAEQQLAKIAKGALKLAKPIMAAGREITELRWDFRDLTGWEYANALDCDNAGVNVFRITNKQAFSLFAAAAAKATTIKNDGGVDMHPLDARDIKERMGIDDTIKAVQVATVFFATSARVGNKRILDV